MTNRRKILKAVGVTGIAGLAGCIGNGNDDSDGNGGDGDNNTNGTNGGDSDTIKIGAYGPLTGPASNIGQAMKLGFDLAQKQINADGGMAGYDVEVVYGDSESEPSTGKSAVEYLINQENVDMIAGGFHSDVSLAVVEVTYSADVPQMISNSVSGSINEKMESQNMKNVFKMSPPSEAYGIGWNGFLNDLQDEGVGYFPFENKRIALIAEDTSYGLPIMESTTENLEENGWDVVSTDEVAVDETNYRSLLTRIKSNEPDVVWAVQTAPSPAANLVSQFREMGFGDTHFMQTFVPSNPEFANLAGDAANGVMWMANIGVVPEFARDVGLVEAWDDEYGEEVPGSSGSLPWDNLMLIKAAMEEIGSLDDLTVDSWSEAVLGLDQIKGSAGYFDWTEDGPFHQALYGKDTIPALGHQIQDGNNRFVWPFNVGEHEIDESYY
ncbi:ABC transporter substrate-binding protein [Natronosalvus rutilus]|uniref:ABC transporter substrate-binding protein n=1 Tax=Natronosalvus rutilus TaxID=2953753 RepID=A0A9E7NER9_9EURY|nr:ABC transporter substrate-binding protein [Natronosalvus rutilus]UTF55654.1 ABC transporter substrate-binding protein [Natronosalvus rutilus]